MLELARQAVRRALMLEDAPRIPTSLVELTDPRSAFVTVRSVDGRLRGCRGECPARRSLPECVRAVAVSSALDDPRFPPVVLEELPDVRFEISSLSEPRPIEPEDVEVGRHGLLLQSESGGGLLLPQVAVHAFWDREDFLEGVCTKAGLTPGAWRRRDVKLFCFEAEVWAEQEPAGRSPLQGPAPHV